MGCGQSQLTEEELQDYKELTFLTKAEIVHTFQRFKAIKPDVIQADKFARLPASLIKKIPELENNPFADRLCRVFDSEGDGCLSFEDFLDMVNVLSKDAPFKTKVEYAFNVFDFDGDGMISEDDITEIVDRLTGADKLTDEEMESLLKKIMDEADLDKDSMLSKAEFEHMARKSPDFINSFQVRF